MNAVKILIILSNSNNHRHHNTLQNGVLDWMLKLAFSTISCNSWDVQDLIRFCRSNQVYSVELREGQDPIKGLSREDIQQAALDFQSNRIHVISIGSGICMKGTGKTEHDNKMKDLEESLFLANHFGARGIRVFLGNFRRKTDDPLVELNEGNIVEMLQAACDLVEKDNKEIWIETHNEYSTGQVLRSLLTKVNRKNCKVIWDIIHPLEEGEQPEETYEWLQDDCVHVHIKDGLPFEKSGYLTWKYTNIGEGIIPISQIVNLLHHKGYDGYLSLEWESAKRIELQTPGLEFEAIFPHFYRYMNNIVRERG
jgi:sugar phosphate isomerase/epimerase